jgi:pimeloyl-ACP methyl ester carboxylesterase
VATPAEEDEMSTTPATPDTILLIHGLWMTPRSWEHFKERYESRGYTVLAPAWPGLEVEVEALNANPEIVTGLDIEQIVDHYDKIVRSLDRPPMIMGHSFGGAFTQILLDRGLGAVGVGLSAATVKGVLDLPLSTIRSSAPGLLKSKGKAAALTPKEFHYAFANTLSEEESNAIYERYAVPGPTTVLHEAAFANFHREPPTKVDFAREGRAPLLLIGFGEDHVIPAKVTRHQEAKYDDNVNITEYKLFEGRPHFPGAPGWEEVADFALTWAMEHAGKTVDEHAAADAAMEGGTES